MIDVRGVLFSITNDEWKRVKKMAQHFSKNKIDLITSICVILLFSLGSYIYREGISRELSCSVIAIASIILASNNIYFCCKAKQLTFFRVLASLYAIICIIAGAFSLKRGYAQTQLARILLLPIIVFTCCFPQTNTI